MPFVQRKSMSTANQALIALATWSQSIECGLKAGAMKKFTLSGLNSAVIGGTIGGSGE